MLTAGLKVLRPCPLGRTTWPSWARHGWKGRKTPQARASEENSDLIGEELQHCDTSQVS